MKNLFFFVIISSLSFANCNTCSYNATLVAVHHGPNIPVYMRVFAEQFKIFNPAMSLIIVVDSVVADPVSKLISRVPLTEVVTSEMIQSDPLDEVFFKQSTLDRTIKNGYWFFTSQRFITLWRLAKHRNMTHIFHAEYDNLIFANLNNLLLKMMDVTEYDNSAAIFDSHNSGAPSFMYFRNASSVESFAQFMVSKAVEGNTDMQVLAKYRLERGPLAIGCLPVISEKCARMHGWLPHFCLYQHASKLGMIFDGRAVGQFIGGVDPSNQAGNTVGFVNSDVTFRVDLLNITWKKEIPFACNYPIVNLHVHSKDLQRWRSVLF